MSSTESARDYYPLSDTIRLYCGWLLAFLSAIYAVGAYQSLRGLPWESPLIAEWFESPLILHAAFLAFLYLLLSSVHRLLGRGLWSGLLLMILGFFLFALFKANT